MKTLCIINQKGGVGKTTTSIMLALGLSMRGYRVLVLDSDPQCNLSSFFKIDTEEARFSLSLRDLYLENKISYNSVIYQIEKNLSIIPCSLTFADADRVLNRYNAHKILKNKLLALNDDFDFCIIDSPPSLGMLSLNNLVASDEIVIPVNASAFSIQGLSNLNQIIKEIKTDDNPELNIAGILFTKWNGRTNISRDSAAALLDIAKEMQTTIFTSRIRQNVAIENSQAENKNLFITNPKSNGAEDYNAFINELLNKLNK